MVYLFLKLKKPDFSRKDETHSLAESSLHISEIEVKPFGGQRPRFISDQDLKGSAPPVVRHFGPENRADGRFQPARLQLGNIPDVPPVLIRPGQKIKGIFHRLDVFLFQDFSESRPNSSYVLHGILQISPPLFEF